MIAIVIVVIVNILIVTVVIVTIVIVTVVIVAIVIVTVKIVTVTNKINIHLTKSLRRFFLKTFLMFCCLWNFCMSKKCLF